MNDQQACCAHVKVVLKHHDFTDGTRSDYWECSDGCGTLFYPETTYAVREVRDKFATAALQGILSANAKMDENFDRKNVDGIIAREAYASADAMITERIKPTPVARLDTDL